jgi:ubiquinone/menaquinone biosynthesis C-methylase UbiE
MSLIYIMIPEFKNKALLNILINLFILAVLLLVARFFTNTVILKEGFVQQEKFVLKKDGKSYDDFYSQIYDKIHYSNPKKELAEILKITGADNNSTFLDVGSGTGSTLNALADSGAKCIGIDKSEAMVSIAKENCGPSIHIKQGDVTEPIQFTRNQFTHILCLNKTIYEIEDKHAFFTNCRYWLRNGGALILHLVDKNRFNTVIGKTFLIDNPQKYVKERIVKSETDFGDFTYLAKYDIKQKSASTFTETFTDAATKNVRQNERTLFMDTEEAVLKVAQQCGFSQHGKINMQPINDDEFQNIYVLV